MKHINISVEDMISTAKKRVLDLLDNSKPDAVSNNLIAAETVFGGLYRHKYSHHCPPAALRQVFKYADLVLPEKELDEVIIAKNYMQPFVLYVTKQNTSQIIPVSAMEVDICYK